MSHFSLKGVLQTSLNHVLCQISSDQLSALPSHLPRLRALQPITLHLRRTQMPLEYVSPLPQQLAAIFDQPATVPMAALMAGLQQAKAVLPANLSTQEQRLLQTVTPRDSAGQLGLQFDQAALILWLNLLLASPWPVPQDVPQATLRPVLSHLGQRLQLSPLALVQHTHARCLGLLATGYGPNSVPQDCPDPEGALRPVLWALVHLVDGLAAEGMPATDLLQRGCHLSEAVYDWLRHFAQVKADQPATAVLVLQAVRQALQHLLEKRLGSLAPAVL